MEYIFDATAVGLRIKNARNAKGWSQAELAERMNTTSQNISKFEKGLSNMEYIAQLSNILDTNLLEDVIDVDGGVTEIGKEILFQLITHKGRCEMWMLEDHYMYGLSEHQITKEVVKLAKIGLVVREKYFDYNEEEIDELFITAKGIIILKNMQLNSTQSEAIEEALNPTKEVIFGKTIGEDRIPARSYEYQIGPASCYAEVIESHKQNSIEKVLRSLPVVSEEEPSNPYRLFFIDYLKRKYQDGYTPELDCIEKTGMFYYSFYESIISRMIFGVDAMKVKEYLIFENNKKEKRKLLEKILNEKNPLYDAKEDELDYDIEHWASLFTDEGDTRYDEIFGDIYKNEISSILILNTRKYALKYLFDCSDLNLVFDTNFEKIMSKLESNEEQKYFQLLRDVWDAFGLDYEGDNDENEDKYDDFYDCGKIYELLKERNCDNPSELFTVDEIRDFICDSFKPASSYTEKAIDAKLKEIVKIKPEVLEYFSFPKSWEENGLAELVRKNSGLF